MQKHLPHLSRSMTYSAKLLLTSARPVICTWLKTPSTPSPFLVTLLTGAVLGYMFINTRLFYWFVSLMYGCLLGFWKWKREVCDSLLMPHLEACGTVVSLRRNGATVTATLFTVWTSIVMVTSVPLDIVQISFSFAVYLHYRLCQGLWNGRLQSWTFPFIKPRCYECRHLNYCAASP